MRNEKRGKSKLRADKIPTSTDKDILTAIRKVQRRQLQVASATLLVFFPAAAGTWVISANLLDFPRRRLRLTFICIVIGLQG